MWRARVAPPTDEAEDGESYHDEFLPSEQLVRHRSIGRGRHGRGAGHRRQRELQDDEPVGQDFEEAIYALEVPQGATAISPMQPLFQ